VHALVCTKRKDPPAFSVMKAREIPRKRMGKQEKRSAETSEGEASDTRRGNYRRMVLLRRFPVRERLEKIGRES